MIGLLLRHSFEEKVLESIYKNNSEDYCVFSTGAPNPKFPVPFLQTLCVYDFDGTAVATDITTALLCASLKLPKKKYFYINSLEWVGHRPLFYEELKNIYLNEELELLVSNQRDYKLIKNLFKVPEFIVENWDFSEIEK